MLTSVSSLAVSAGAYREVQTYRYGAGAVRTRMRSNKIDRADRAVAQLDRAAGHEWRRRALALTSHRWSTVNPSGRRGMRCTRVKYRHSKQPYDNIIEVHLSQKKTDSKE